MYVNDLNSTPLSTYTLFSRLLLIGRAKYGFNIIVSGCVAWICEEQYYICIKAKHAFMVTKFEWRVVKCGCKSRHQKDLCLEEIGLHAQNLLTILGFKSHHNWGGGPIYMTT